MDTSRFEFIYFGASDHNAGVVGGDQGRGAAWWGEWDHLEPGTLSSAYHTHLYCTARFYFPSNQDGSWNPVPKDEEAERLRKEKEAEEKKNEVTQLLEVEINSQIETKIDLPCVNFYELLLGFGWPLWWRGWWRGWGFKGQEGGAWGLGDSKCGGEIFSTHQQTKTKTPDSLLSRLAASILYMRTYDTILILENVCSLVVL